MTCMMSSLPLTHTRPRVWEMIISAPRSGMPSSIPPVYCQQYSSHWMADPHYCTYFKSGDCSAVNDNRPISLLCIVSKVLVRMVYDKTLPFLLQQLLTVFQFGFLPCRSVIQQLLTLANILNYNQMCWYNLYILTLRRLSIQCRITSCFWSCGLLG